MRCSIATVLIVAAATAAPAIAAPYPQIEGSNSLAQRDVHEPGLWERALEAVGLFTRGRNSSNRPPAPDPTFPRPPSGHRQYTRRTEADLQARVDEALELLARGTHTDKGPQPDPTFPTPHGQRRGHRTRSDDEELMTRFDEEDDLFARGFDDEELFARFDDEDLYARFDDEDLFARYDDEDLFARFDGGLEMEELD